MQAAAAGPPAGRGDDHDCRIRTSLPKRARCLLRSRLATNRNESASKMVEGQVAVPCAVCKEARFCPWVCIVCEDAGVRVAVCSGPCCHEHEGDGRHRIWLEERREGRRSRDTTSTTPSGLRTLG